MIDPTRVCSEVFKAIKSNDWQVALFDEEGMTTYDSEMAVRFYVEKPNFLIFVDGDNQVIEINRNGNEKLHVYANVIDAIQLIAMQHPGYTCDIRDYGKHITPKDFAYKVSVKESIALDEYLLESKMFGSKRTSKQVIESVRIVVKHKRDIDEAVKGSRSRNISAIFLESNGERSRFPYNSLLGARAMARHMVNGGSLVDNIGESIVELTGKMVKLHEFHRYVKRNKLINESSADIVSALVESIYALRSDLTSLSKKRTYETTIARLLDNSFIVEADTTDYKDMFTVKKFDSVFETIIPMISNIVQEKNMKMKKIEESSLRPITAIKQLSESDSAGIVYASKSAQFGNKLKDLSHLIRENDELANFLSKVGDKMISEGVASPFEMKIVKNVFENIKFGVKYEAKVGAITESVNVLSKSLGKIEKGVYNTMVSEGILDVLSGVRNRFKSFSSSTSPEDELFELGTRLKNIQAELQSREGDSATLEDSCAACEDTPISEVAKGFGAEALKTPTKQKYAIAVSRFMAVRKGLGLANKLKNPVDRKKHKSQVMVNMNLLRRDVESLELALEKPKEKPKDERKDMLAPNKFLNGIWGNKRGVNE